MILLFAKCLVYLFVLSIFYRLFFGVAVYMHLKLDSCHEFSFISTLSSSFPFYMFSYYYIGISWQKFKHFIHLFSLLPTYDNSARTLYFPSLLQLVLLPLPIVITC